jgi:hypothetical protein
MSGLVVGLLAGVVARVAMRLVAIAGGEAPAFTVSGSLTILTVSVLYGILGALVFAWIRRRLPGPPVAQGWTFGILVWVLYGLPLIIADQVDELHVAPALGVVLFGAIFVLAGPALSLATSAFERLIPPSKTGPGALLQVALVIAVLLGSAPAVLSTYVLAGRKFVALVNP